MANNSIFDDDDDDDLYDDVNADKNLRTHAKKIEKQNKQLLERLAAFEAKERKDTITAVIKAQELDPLVADLVPSDVTTAEAAAAWLTKFGPLFGKAPTPATNAAPTDESGAGTGQGGPGGTAKNVDPAVLREMQKQAEAEASSSSSELGAVEAALANTTSQDDVKALLSQYSSMRG